ncbi:MAG: class II glutamine amidotransferase [Candidatus Bathyarchaeia archaeon]
MGIPLAITYQKRDCHRREKRCRKVSWIPHVVGQVRGFVVVYIAEPADVVLDEDFGVDLSGLKAEDEVATIIATGELTSEVWIRFPERKLMVFRDGLPYLSREQLTILKYVRSSPHRVSIRSISDGLGISIEETAANILELKELGMLKQDGRDRVPANHPDATFYTNPDLRSTIDRILNYLKI